MRERIPKWRPGQNLSQQSQAEKPQRPVADDKPKPKTPAEPTAPEPDPDTEIAGNAAEESVPAEDGRSYVRGVLTDLLQGDPEVLCERLQWFPVGKRPSIGLRWGIGVAWPQGTDPPEVYAVDELENAAGQIGPEIAAGLQDRMAEGRFGQWPESADPAHMQLAVLGAAENDELIAAAKRQGLDVLLVLPPVQPAAEEARGPGAIELLDVPYGKSLWTREITDSEEPGQTAAAVLEKIDETCTLKQMPPLRPVHITRRIGKLVEMVPQLDDTLPIAVELRYYQARELLVDGDIPPVLSELLSQAPKPKPVAEPAGAKQ